ncbi:Gas vesicle protein G [Micromonospora rhizosphaerae]|uniref:Gas vesicle protein G n=1 Tax=Micromonospora rhizosphaerae TaxID=568872 RepID=A0A1C6RB12_9ACTN|nr:gas vesicle protein GvpG [Micromonospora rhizosphaerae]SCL14326.1 Gas vesicle protein G [Micromonospora rhizosphaerae]
MGILWGLLTWPYAPVRGLTAVVRVMAREAESQQYNPVNIRRELEELDRAAAAGEITERERDRRQQQVLERLAEPAAGTGPTRPSAGRRAPPAGQRRPVVRRAGRRGDQERG